jgi:hypothetical protein
VQTVTEIGWRTAEDESLLMHAQQHFDVFVTVDRKLEKEQDLSTFALGFIIVRIPTNRLDAFEPILDDLRYAVDEISPGGIVYVVSPKLKK